MRLFLDSGAFIARAISDDANHEPAASLFRELSQRTSSYRQLFTSNYVVDETVTYLLYRASPRVAVEVLDWMRGSPALRILHVSEEVEALADQAFRQFASSGVSYTDCTTKVLMERESIDTAFAFDRDIEVLGFHRVP